MEKSEIVAVFLLVGLAIAGGCIAVERTHEQIGTSQASSMEPKIYEGFPEYKAGMWVEYSYPGHGNHTTRIEVIGEEIVEERESIGFEITTLLVGGERFVQVWISKRSPEPVKYVVKNDPHFGNHTVCLFEERMQRQGLPYVGEGGKSTPAEFDTKREYTGTYATPTGKAVDFAEFAIGRRDVLVSGEVPLGIVKESFNNRTVSELYDYGFTGASRDISEDELRNCEQYDVTLFLSKTLESE